MIYLGTKWRPWKEPKFFRKGIVKKPYFRMLKFIATHFKGIMNVKWQCLINLVASHQSWTHSNEYGPINIPDVNGVTLIEQILSLKYSSKGWKVTSCQSWRFEKKSCHPARVKPHACSPASSPGQFDHPCSPLTYRYPKYLFGKILTLLLI